MMDAQANNLQETIPSYPPSSLQVQKGEEKEEGAKVDWGDREGRGVGSNQVQTQVLNIQTPHLSPSSSSSGRLARELYIVTDRQIDRLHQSPPPPQTPRLGSSEGGGADEGKGADRQSGLLPARPSGPQEWSECTRCFGRLLQCSINSGRIPNPNTTTISLMRNFLRESAGFVRFSGYSGATVVLLFIMFLPDILFLG